MTDVDHPPVPIGSTFLVRIWLEWSRSGSCWRGQIIHVQSGERGYFLSLDNMLNFLQGYVAMPKAEDRESTRDR